MHSIFKSALVTKAVSWLNSSWSYGLRNSLSNVNIVQLLLQETGKNNVNMHIFMLTTYAYERIGIDESMSSGKI